MIWNFDGIVFMLAVLGFVLSALVLMHVVMEVGGLLRWAWEQLRILRRRDGQDV